MIQNAPNALPSLIDPCLLIVLLFASSAPLVSSPGWPVPTLTWHRSQTQRAPGRAGHQTEPPSVLVELRTRLNEAPNGSSDGDTSGSSSLFDNYKVIHTNADGSNLTSWISAKLVLDPLRATDYNHLFLCRVHQDNQLDNRKQLAANLTASFTMDMNREWRNTSTVFQH